MMKHTHYIHGISVNRYTILEKIFTPPLFPKAKNYRTTKKKGSASFYTSKLNFLHQYLETFGFLTKNFTPPPKILHHPGW